MRCGTRFSWAGAPLRFCQVDLHKPARQISTVAVIVLLAAVAVAAAVLLEAVLVLVVQRLGWHSSRSCQQKTTSPLLMR